MFDVYAMGLVVHELLSGTHPLAAEDAPPLTLCDRHLHATAPPLRAVVPEVGGELSDLVARALEKDPARRCAMSDLAARLEQELDRWQAPRRRAARNAVARDEEPSMATTIPMSAYPGPDDAAEREAALPPAPSAEVPEAEVPVPATLRVLSRPVTVIAVEAAAAIEAEAARRSTSAPVESAARRSLPAGRGRAAVVGAVAALSLAAGAAVTWWSLGLRGSGGGEAPRVAGPGPAVSSSAAVSGSASASAKVAAPRPSGSASAGRPAGKVPKGGRR